MLYNTNNMSETRSSKTDKEFHQFVANFSA